ncbi:MAG: AtpZ/AtpI family protein [Candidatus Komeilibacteria bacterium]|nr:AtpZ/AtpI family protein [Candidatus Komeilibacteria bacterium]
MPKDPEKGKSAAGGVAKSDSRSGSETLSLDPEVSRPNGQDRTTGGWWKPAVAVFGEVTGWIVVPIVGALYLGRYLDEQQGTGNLYFLSLTALAFIISCIGIGIVGVKYIRQIEGESKKEKKNGSRNSI